MKTDGYKINWCYCDAKGETIIFNGNWDTRDFSPMVVVRTYYSLPNKR